MKKEKLVYVISLGCSKNFVDTEIMAASLVTHNIGITSEIRDADICLINTCAFIQSARDETVEVIEDTILWKNKKKRRKIIVSGCITQWDKDGEFRKKYDKVDLWMGVDDSEKIYDKIATIAKQGEKVVLRDKPTYLYDEKTPRLQLTLPHFSYVKIADGCDNNCSYCSIPNIRGKFRSRTISSVRKESQNLLNNGVKELLFIAQDVTSYGKDREKENIVELLKEIDTLEGDFWIRLMYAHPAYFTDELIELMKNSKHILPYIDIPFQHISDNILESMNRKVSKKESIDLIKKLRKVIPEITFRTTFLVGYPGETEKDFQELYDFVKEIKFDRLGVFPYSLEPNTKAYSMENQVSAEIANERCDKLMQLQSEIALENNQKLIGKEFTVIIDSFDEEEAISRSYQDAPEIDNLIVFDAPAHLDIGDFAKVKVVDCSEYDLVAEFIG